MSQLLIVQGAPGGDRQEIEALFSRGVYLFRSLYRLDPADTANGHGTYAAVFPHLQRPLASFVRGPAEGSWIGGAGCWFYDGLTGEPGLQRLAASRSPLTSAPPESFRDLDGIFALASWEPSGRLTVVTDRLGSLHIYSAKIGASIATCTSSLVLAALSPPAWDPASCREFLATGNIYESRTLFRGIEKLPPASVLAFEGGREISRRKYWVLADVMYDRSPERGTVPQLAAALEETLDTIGKNFPAPLLDLTGGLDSRALVGAAISRGIPFETIVNGGSADPDVIAAQRVADRFQLRHRRNPRGFASVEEWWQTARQAFVLCDGEYDPLLYAGTLEVQSSMSRHFNATVNGSNGEICKGYWWELLFPFTRWRSHFDTRKVAARRFAFHGEVPGLVAGAPSEPLADWFAAIIERANQGLERHPNTAKLDNVYLTLRMQCWQGRICSATSRIWPTVQPFTFRRPMEVALSAPPSVRLRCRMSRRLIEHQNPVLAALPLAEGYPALPLRLRTAHLFGPLLVQQWHAVQRRLRSAAPISKAVPSSPYSAPFSDLARIDEVRDLLDPSSMLTRDLYNAKVLGGLLSGWETPHFRHAERAARILDLEMLARAIR